MLAHSCSRDYPLPITQGLQLEVMGTHGEPVEDVLRVDRHALAGQVVAIESRRV